MQPEVAQVPTAAAQAASEFVLLGSFPASVRAGRDRRWQWSPPAWLCALQANHGIDIDSVDHSRLRQCKVVAVVELAQGAAAEEDSLQAWGVEADVLHEFGS